MSAVGNKALTSLVSCSPSPAMHPSCHSSVPTFYNGMKIVHLFKNKSQTWVKEGGGGHPTRLLLVVQQLVAGLEVLVTVLTAVLPFLCTVGGRNISILCILVRYMRCSGLGNWQKRVLVRVCGADHEYQEPWCHMNTLQPSWKVAAPHRGKSLWWLCRRSATHTHTHMIKIVLFLSQFNYRGQTKLNGSTYFAVLNLPFFAVLWRRCSCFCFDCIFSHIVHNCNVGWATKFLNQKRSLGVALGTV